MRRLPPWHPGSTFPCTKGLPLPYTPPSPGFTMRPTSLFCCLRPSLVLLLGPIGTTRGGPVVPQGHLGMSMLLLLSVSPIFILGPTFNPFKERSTDMRNVVTNPIIRNLSPLIWAHHITQEVGGIQIVEGPASERLNNIHHEVLNHRCLSVPIPCVIAVGDILQGVSIL